MEKKYYFRVKNSENFIPPLPHAEVQKPEIKVIKGDIEFTEKEYEQLKDKTTLIISYKFCPDFWGEMMEVAKVEGEWKVYVLEDEILSELNKYKNYVYRYGEAATCKKCGELYRRGWICHCGYDNSSN